MIQVISENMRASLSEQQGREEGQLLTAEEAMGFILKMTRDVRG